jgi:hypothetical protein
MAKKSYDDEDDDRDDMDDEDDIERKPKRKKGGGGLAAERLNGPAIGLMVLSGITLFLNCLGVPFAIYLMTQGPRMGPPQGGMDFGQNAAVNLVSAIIGLAVQGFILYGAIQMKAGKSYGICMATAILSCIPCFCSSCIILGVPFGIWALMVMNDPDVKASFTS